MSVKRKFDKIERVAWILASDNGCVLAHGHPDPKMPPYHLDALTDRLPELVQASNKITLGDAKRAWNGRVRKSDTTREVKGRLLVHEQKVRIVIAAAGAPLGPQKSFGEALASAFDD